VVLRKKREKLEKVDKSDGERGGDMNHMVDHKSAVKLNTVPSEGDELGRGMTQAEYKALVDNCFYEVLAAEKQLEELRQKLMPVYETAQKIGLSGRFLTFMKLVGGRVDDLEHVLIEIREGTSHGTKSAPYYKAIVDRMVLAKPELKVIVTEAEKRLETLAKGWQKIQVWDRESPPDDKRKSAPFEIKVAKVRLISAKGRSFTVQIPETSDKVLRAVFIREAQTRLGGFEILRKFYTTVHALSEPAVQWLRDLFVQTLTPWSQHTERRLADITKQLQHVSRTP
jgi:hypothetical protein